MLTLAHNILPCSQLQCTLNLTGKSTAIPPRRGAAYCAAPVAPLFCKFLDSLSAFSTESIGPTEAPSISLNKWKLGIGSFSRLAFELPPLCASLIHFNLENPEWVLPDRTTIPHNVAFFQNLRNLLPDICHKHGLLAIGGMTALYDVTIANFQQELGYRAVTHQRFLGTGYFGEIAQVVSSGNSSTIAMAGSAEAEQFHGTVLLAPSNGHSTEAHALRIAILTNGRSQSGLSRTTM